MLVLDVGSLPVNIVQFVVGFTCVILSREKPSLLQW